MKRASASTACESFYYGEVEDYTVNIGASAILAFTGSLENTTENDQKADQYIIYPNPTSSSLNVSSPDNKGFSYRIITSSGIQIVSGKTADNNINTSNLNPGIYILELNDGNKTITKTFMKK
jgi:bacillolysin